MIQAYYHTLRWSHWTLSFVHIQNWDRDLVEVLDDGCQQLQWELPTQVAQCKYSSRPQHTNAVTQQGMTITTFPNTKPKIKMPPENWIFWIILHLNKLSIYSMCISFGRRLKSLLRAMQWPLVFWPAMWRAALSPKRQCLPRILWCLMLGSPVNCGKPFEDQDVMSGLYVRWTNVILM